MSTAIMSNTLRGINGVADFVPAGVFEFGGEAFSFEGDGLDFRFLWWVSESDGERLFDERPKGDRFVLGSLFSTEKEVVG